MKNSNSTSLARTTVAVLSFGLLALTGASGSAAEAPDAASYTWSAELVAFDKANNTVTVKSLLLDRSSAADLERLRAGDRAMLTWSGLSAAAGIRAIESGNDSSYDRMTMPVEFVSTELDGRYVSFKVPIPAADAAAIERLSPGAWLTATSPHRPKDSTEAVSSIRPYGDVG
jgi:hypothetical protein